MMPPTTLLNPRISAICPFICGSSSSISSTTISCCNVFQHQCAYAFSQKRFSNFRRMAPSLLLSFQPHLNGIVNVDVDEEEELVLGDCLVFEEGIFDDPYVEESLNRSEEMNNSESIETGKVIDVKPENLVPDNWLEDQKEINITKKERRKLAFEEQFGRKVEKRKLEMRPIESSSGSRFVNYREEKLKQLKPIVLDSPAFRKGKVNEEKGEEKISESSSRVAPRNPKWAVYGGGLDDITKFFNSGTYDPNAKKSPEGTGKLLSKEEKLLLNRRIPDLAVATSGKWKPFHTLAASGEFYLATSLLKHNIDINLRDENGLTAIHKAILGKKQAIFNLLLRESANPFICDKEGATLMHYAVRTASCQMIKILLLYNVDIDRQDNDGWTPLHLAVQTRRTDIIRLLLIKGADKTLRNQDGLTPLDLSLHSGHDSRTYEIIKLFKYLPKTRAQ